MKKFTKFMSLLTASALLVLLPTSNTLTASADATTYSIAYVEENGEWRYQENSDFDLGKSHHDADDIGSEIKDGDLLVIYGNADHSGSFDIPVSLSNLTILGAQEYVVVSTNGITDFYGSYDSIAAVAGNIQNAYLYDNTQVTFNGNVGNLDINAHPDSYALATCTGTVGHVIGHYDGTVYYDVYNVAAGKLEIEEMTLETEAQYYSTTPDASPAAATQPAPAPSASTSNTATDATSNAASTTTPQAAADEYDDVPKTGESPIVFWLLGIAIVSLAGSLALKRV